MAKPIVDYSTEHLLDVLRTAVVELERRALLGQLVQIKDIEARLSAERRRIAVMLATIPCKAALRSHASRIRSE